MANFFESGKNKAAKEAVPMIQWDSNLIAPTAIRLWETFTLTFGDF